MQALQEIIYKFQKTTQFNSKLDNMRTYIDFNYKPHN